METPTQLPDQNPPAGEAQRTPDSLAFMGITAVEDFRKSQKDLLDQAGNQAIASAGDDPDPFKSGLRRARDEARTQKATEFDDLCDAYVAQHVDAAAQPELFGKLSSLLKSVSLHNMDNEKWYLGEKDFAGNHTKPETSGQSILETKLQELRDEYAPAPDDTPEDPDTDDTTEDEEETALIDTPEMRALRVRVEEARKKAAKLSVELRSKIVKWRRKNKDLRAEYDAADKQYHELFTELNLAEVRLMKAAGRTDQQVLSEGITNLLNEHQAFSLVEKDIITHDDSRKGRFFQWLAKRRLNLLGTTAAAGVAIGYGSSWAIKGLVGTGVGISAPIALGAAAAVKSTRAILAATVTNHVDQLVHFDKRYAEDKAELTNASGNFTTGTTDEETAKQHSNALRKLLGNRIEKDRKYNRNRVIAAAAIGGVAGGLGVLAHEAVDTQGFGIWASHDQTPAGPSAGAGNPPGGGGSGGEGNGGGSGAQAAAGNNGSGIEKVAVVDPNVVDGYDTNVVVENGHGYQREIIELLQEKNQHLSSDDSWKLYLHLQDKFPNGNFFTDNASYKMDDGYFGISRPGGSHWNPAVIHEINRWMAENASKVTTS